MDGRWGRLSQLFTDDEEAVMIHDSGIGNANDTHSSPYLYVKKGNTLAANLGVL